MYIILCPLNLKDSKMVWLISF